jgi:hypothetical protein
MFFLGGVFPHIALIVPVMWSGVCMSAVMVGVQRRLPIGPDEGHLQVHFPIPDGIVIG